MTNTDLLLQQVINGVSLGAMYSMIALGFTLVYGIMELINFAHFNIFMVGSFIALYVLEAFGLDGQSVILAGLPLVLALGTAMVASMVGAGILGRRGRAGRTATAAQRERAIGDDQHHRRCPTSCSTWSCCSWAGSRRTTPTRSRP